MTVTGPLSDLPPNDAGVKAAPGIQTRPEEMPPFPARHRGAPVALGLLIGINLFNYIDRQILSANLPNIEKDFLGAGHPVSKAMLGLLSTAFMVAYMIFAPLFGWLADRVTRWHLIGVGVMIWSLASGASGFSSTTGGLALFAGSYWILLSTRCLVGIGEAAYGPIAPTIIADLYPIEKRGQVLAWFYAAIPVGSALGYTIGGQFGWPYSFYLVVPPGIALGLWCFFLPEPKRMEVVRHVTLKDYKLLLNNTSYILDTVGMVGLTFALGGIGIWMPYYITEYRHVGKLEDVAWLFGVIVVVSGLGATILGGLVGDWLRPKYSGSYFLVSGVAMLVGLPLFLAVLVCPFPYAWLLIFASCFCLFFNTGPTNTILANVTHPSLRAPAFALNILVIHLLGDAGSPYLIGLIADWTNMDIAFVAMSSMILLGGIVWIIGARHLAYDTANASRQLDEPA